MGGARSPTGNDMKYRKKPVVIEAFRLGFEPLPEWALLEPTLRVCVFHGVTDASIQTLEGKMLANHGDYVIKGIRGELYPCKPDIFEATYEAV